MHDDRSLLFLQFRGFVGYTKTMEHVLAINCFPYA